MCAWIVVSRDVKSTSNCNRSFRLGRAIEPQALRAHELFAKCNSLSRLLDSSCYATAHEYEYIRMYMKTYTMTLNTHRNRKGTCAYAFSDIGVRLVFSRACSPIMCYMPCITFKRIGAHCAVRASAHHSRLLAVGTFVLKIHTGVLYT